MRWVGESSSGRLAPAPAGHVAPPDPAPAARWFYARGRSGRTRGGLGPLWGVRALGCWRGASFPQGHVASPGRPPSGERVRGRWPGEVSSGPQGSSCSVPYGVVTDNYASPTLLQLERVSLPQSTDTP